MAEKDTTSLRPQYLSWTLRRDFHYAVYDSHGNRCLTLVTNKGEKRAFFVKEPNNKKYSVVYVNTLMDANVDMGNYSRDCTDLMNTLRQHNFPPGEYGMSVVNASDERQSTFNFYI